MEKKRPLTRPPAAPVSATGVIWRRPVYLMVGLIALAAMLPAGARASAPLTLGLDDFGPLSSSNPVVATPWLDRVRALGGSLVRINIGWSAVAPRTFPPGFQEADPGSPHYDWSAVDAAVRATAAEGLTPLLGIDSAPRWAEGANRPRSVLPGTWRPGATAFGRFARAAALRYSGHYPDPLHPRDSLPHVRFWEAWNEPNLAVYLSPQWIRSGRRFIAASPSIYRGLLRSFYASIKAVSRANVVVAGATAPFGDLAPSLSGTARMPPVSFVKGLLCLRAARLRSAGCPAPVRFDILDHHPYGIGGPLRHAADPEDVSVPDMAKLTRLLRAATRAGTLAPRSGTRIWTTELAWASRPPDPLGVPVERQARWLEQALYVLWREGVAGVFWLQIVDDPSPGGLRAGLYYADGRPKPAVTAFRFPFVTVRRNAHQIVAWGRAPASGEVLIQRREAERWLTVRRFSAKAGATFQKTFALSGSSTLRARVGAAASLTWHQS